MGCASPLPHEAWKLGQRPLYCIPPGVDPERALSSPVSYGNHGDRADKSMKIGTCILWGVIKVFRRVATNIYSSAQKYKFYDHKNNHKYIIMSILYDSIGFKGGKLKYMNLLVLTRSTTWQSPVQGSPAALQWHFLEQSGLALQPHPLQALLPLASVFILVSILFHPFASHKVQVMVHFAWSGGFYSKYECSIAMLK